MKFLLTLCLFALSSSPAFAQTGVRAGNERIGLTVNAVELPSDVLGEVLREWFAVINSGDNGRIRKFADTRFSADALRHQRSAEQYAALFIKLHQQSGGLDIVRITPSDGTQPMAILAKARNGDRYVLITAGLDRSEQGKLAGLGIDRAESPGATNLDAAGPISEGEMVSRITAFLDKRAAEGAFSGVVLIANDDKVLLQKAYGYSDREAKVPNTPATKFHLASVGKMFTAVAIARLVEAGKLSFDDTVGKAYPGFPNKDIAEQVTIRQLLTHSGGLGTFFQSPGFVRGKRYKNATEEIEVYKDEKLFSKPGTRWRYSNASFSLLAAIIERHSGKTYLEYIRENIFRPLGMRETYTNEPAAPEPGASVFYTQSPDDPLGIEAFIGNRELASGPISGFGGGFSNAGDMFKFLRAYRTGKLLGGNTARELYGYNVKQDASGERLSAMGLFEYERNGEVVRGHAGGSRTDVEMLWNSGYTVIVMSNAFPPSVHIVSGGIINFITKQNALRKLSGSKMR